MASVQEITQSTTEWLATADDRKRGRKNRVAKRGTNKFARANDATPSTPEIPGDKVGVESASAEQV